MIVDKGYAKAAVINLQGAVYLDAVHNPFECAKEEIAKAREAGAGTIIIDFHAEATSEKRALGFYLDGEASVISERTLMCKPRTTKFCQTARGI